MNYYELQIMDNVAKIHYYPELREEDLIMGSQQMKIQDLSIFKIHTQKIKATGKLLDFYIPSSNLSRRLIVSTKAKSLLESYRKDNIRFYPCPVLRGQEPVEGYYITDKVIFDDEWVNFSKSDFIYVNRKITSKGNKNYDKSVQIKTFKDLIELQEFEEKKMSYMDELHPHKIFIKERCPHEIISIPSTGIYQIIVTEKLKIELQKQKMDKGIEFKPLEIPDEEWGGPSGLRKKFYK